MEARVRVHEIVLAFLHGQRITNQSGGEASSGKYMY